MGHITCLSLFQTIGRATFLNNSVCNQRLKAFVPRNLCWKRTMSSGSMCTDIVWMDMEMSGLDFIKDKILEVSCLITDKDLNLKSEGPCLIINQPMEVFENMNEWCKKHHYQSGLVEKCLKSGITQKEAETALLEYLKTNIPKSQCPLGGSSVYMDRLFLRAHMPMVDEYLHYRIIDVSTVQELARRWNPPVRDSAPAKKYAHRSLDDIRESVEQLKYYRDCFFRQS